VPRPYTRQPGHNSHGPLAILFALAAACQELDHPSLVKDLRLLAVTVEPPELILDPDAPLVPEVEVTPLLADPRGDGRPLTFTARACGNDPLAPSAPGAGSEGAANYPAGGARSTVGSARCPPDGPTSWTLVSENDARPAGTSLRVAFTGTQLAAAFAADVFPGHLGQPHGGFDLGLPIALQITGWAGDETAVGIKRVIVWAAPIRADQRPNRNPQVQQVRTFPDRDPHTLEPSGPIDTLAAGEPRPLPADQPLWLEPLGAEAEPYLTRTIDRLTDQTQVREVDAETLDYAFYATAGRFDPARTTSELPFGARPGDRLHLESKYQPPAPADLPLDPASGRRQQEVTIWIVVRDERGGSSFLERRLLVHESDPR
jgi:hypothetical protein